jgi:23S rRNA pseudouridine2605 synthase
LQQGKWQSVGRLDLNTEGLLLLTSSGELANSMMHPSFGLEREYAARVLGALTAQEKEQLLAGIELEDGPAQFGSISDGGGEGANQWYQVTINEGRNREVRRMFETLGHAVSRLIRIRYGVVQLPRGLRRGFYMELGEHDVKALMEAAGMSTHERKGPLTRIDPKREQARSRGLRRAQPRAGEMEPDFRADDGDGDWDNYDAPAQPGQQAPYAEQGQGQGHAEDGQEPRFRRTPFGRKRPVGGQGQGQRRNTGQGGQGGGGRDFPREPREQREPRPTRAQRDNRAQNPGQGQQRRYDADDEFSQRGVSHESPFEAKASRKRIFSSGNQVPDIIKAQRGGAGGGGGNRGGQRGGGGQGGIDPMRTSLGFIGGDSYRNSGGGNKRGGGSGRSGGGRGAGGFGGQRSGGNSNRGRGR